jgi:signal transduction histidine kinase
MTTAGDNVRAFARMRVGIAAGFAVLGLAVAAAIAAAIGSSQAAYWIAHSLEVRQTEAQLFSLLQDAETGQRGYLLTEDQAYLAPYRAARKELPPLRRHLADLVADNAGQQARLQALLPLFDSKMDELRRTVDLFQAGQRQEALAMVRTDEGRQLMTRIRAGVAAFDQAELALLSDRTARASSRHLVLLGVMVASSVVLCLLIYLVHGASRRYTLELQAANARLVEESMQREQAESRLRQAQKMEALGQLTGGVAHDFNNMLAIIVGNLDILLRRLSPADAQFRSYAENALLGARRAAELTKRLLAFSRLQPLKPRAVDVNKCVQDMSEMLRRSFGETIQVETVLAGGAWRGYVDLAELESAILNLAVNARDAMKGKGRLTIETANASLDQAYADANVDVAPGQYVMVAVTDTGTGMTEEVLQKAFEPFFTTKAVGRGTGLGLSQVHGFAKQSKGHIKIYSEPGVGTTVKLYLPRDTSAPAEPDPRPVSADAAPLDRKILVVEDDVGVRAFTVAALRELGYAALEADGPEAALRLLATNPDVSLLLTDVVMPGMTGRQLADRVRAARPDIIVLYMTGYTRNAIVHNGTLDPGVRLLTKPFTIDDLGRELRAALA